MRRDHQKIVRGIAAQPAQPGMGETNSLLNQKRQMDSFEIHNAGEKELRRVLEAVSKIAGEKFRDKLNSWNTFSTGKTTWYYGDLKSQAMISVAYGAAEQTITVKFVDIDTGMIALIRQKAAAN